jgi:quercetin dioxygenase-like cupin family protein
MDRAAFEAELIKDSFSVSEGQMSEAEPKPQHTHDFTARAMVLEGAITLRTGDTEHTYRVGDIYSLDAGTMHTEVVGPGGVRYLAGLR